MKLLCITDIHSDHARLDQILSDAGPADLAILGGDLTNFGSPDEAARLVRRVQQAVPRVLAVAGNCDSPAIDERLRELEVSLFGCGVVCEGVGFYGVSAMPPWRGTMYELTEEQIAAALNAGRRQLGPVRAEVVVSHAPPRDSLLDRSRRGEHVGSTALRRFLGAAEPTLLVCGHIHEAWGTDQLGKTLGVNCGPAFRGHYALCTLGQTCQIDLRTASPQTRSGRPRED